MSINEERVQRYAEALYGQRHGRMLTADGETTHVLRAVMAVADAEQAELRAEVERLRTAYGDAGRAHKQTALAHLRADAKARRVEALLKRNSPMYALGEIRAALDGE